VGISFRRIGGQRGQSLDKRDKSKSKVRQLSVSKKKEEHSVNKSGNQNKKYYKRGDETGVSQKAEGPVERRGEKNSWAITFQQGKGPQKNLK